VSGIQGFGEAACGCTCPGRSRYPCGLGYVSVVVQVDLLAFDRSPQALDEDVVHESAPTVHADFHALVQQHGREIAIGKLRPLVGVEDLRQAEVRKTNAISSRVDILLLRGRRKLRRVLTELSNGRKNPHLIHVMRLINGTVLLGFTSLLMTEYAHHPTIAHDTSFLGIEALLILAMFIVNYFGASARSFS
jgi:hypothetical protein